MSATDKKSLFSRVGYLYIPANNIDESIEWYQSKLGLTLKMPKFQDDIGNVAVLSPPEGDVVILLAETKDDTTANFLRNGLPFQTVTLNCPDLKYTHEKLKDSGVEVSEIRNRGENAKYFLITDPSGNLIEAAWSIWD
ncbi:VOC family protein [Metabacillus malikii]|uniref:Enzyme related to lactoylglutathione lyase n=1 Tax=Metabacillus malikii TaxID=1504265 RepID=A0ABT9ZB09_9BACI|nr:VOC family protein [Metabacillus malikii]MDQ0229027.1 putative enzyme related to lactoylglutathione lyase [Metabacillus malikii]